MAEKPRVSIQLNKCVLAEHGIRYLSLSDNGYVHSTTINKMTQMKDTPLFLATDILSGIEQDKKNFYRIHSRFAKDGLATKLTFKEAVLVGINNSSGVWFYSVQGLFQAVFQYHHLKTQSHCILELLNLWLSRYEDEKLVSAITVKIKSQDDSLIHQSPSAMQAEVTITEIDTQPSSNECSSDIVTNLQTTNDSLCNIYTKLDVQSLASITNKHAQQSDCDKTKVISGSEHNSVKLPDMLNSFINTLKAEQEKSPRKFYNPLHIETVCSVLQVFINDLNKPYQGFPFHLIPQYQSEVEKNLGSLNEKEEFGISQKSRLALCVISDWLGQEFNRLEPEIALKVEKFKTDHIDCIDNLPEAESMVDMLFPTCMKCLLCSWVGIGQPSVNVDHDYGNQSKRCKPSYQTSKNLFPLIEIILEFMNNALISGVAHVVFTRLLLTT